MRNIFLFFAVVLVVLGLFFGTRGCGTVKPLGFSFSTDIEREHFLGPVFAEKEGRYVFYPGEAVLKGIDPEAAGWEDELTDAINEKVQACLDTMALKEGISEVEIAGFIAETVRKELQNASIESYISGKRKLSFDVTPFLQVRTFRKKIKLNMDSLQQKLQDEIEGPRGNY